MKKLLTITLLLLLSLNLFPQQQVRIYLYDNTINVLQIKQNIEPLEIPITSKTKIVYENNSISLYSTSRGELNNMIKHPTFHRFYFDGEFWRCSMFPDKTLSEGYNTYFMRNKYKIYFYEGTEEVDIKFIYLTENF